VFGTGVGMGVNLSSGFGHAAILRYHMLAGKYVPPAAKEAASRGYSGEFLTPALDLLKSLASSG
jgi:hypothetical protein